MLYVGLIFLVIVLGRAEQVKSQMAWTRVAQNFCSQEELVSGVGLSTTTRDQMLYLMGSQRSHMKCVSGKGEHGKSIFLWLPPPHWPTVHPKE